MLQKIPDFLIRKLSRPVNPYSNWKTYKNGDIVFSSDKKFDRWDAHPEGLILETDKSLFINGEGVQSERERERISCGTAILKGLL